jgi:hypothetical protein
VKVTTIRRRRVCQGHFHGEPWSVRELEDSIQLQRHLCDQCNRTFGPEDLIFDWPHGNFCLPCLDAYWRTAAGMDDGGRRA